MEQACQADNMAREKGQPAIHKLKLLPEVVALLNRNTVQHSIVDPDTNFLQSVKFFLEPLNDGSLPAYNIQRDLFQSLTHLRIEKDALLSSGIGKVVLYYTKSRKPEVGIKRIAERLLGEWSRPILKRSDDYRKRQIVTKDFDHQYLSLPKLAIFIFTNSLPGPLNLQSAPLASHHKCLLLNPQASLNVTSNANVFWLNPSVAIELGWRVPMQVTPLRQRVLSTEAKVPIHLLDLLAQVVWRHLER